jgi:ADP-ribose pyrophosphatase
MEETGYSATKLTLLASNYPYPTKNTYKVHLFVAEEVEKKGEQNLDVTEDIEIVPIPLENVRGVFAGDDPVPSTTLLAIFCALRHLGKLGILEKNGE